MQYQQLQQQQPDATTAEGVNSSSRRSSATHGMPSDDDEVAQQQQQQQQRRRPAKQPQQPKQQHKQQVHQHHAQHHKQQKQQQHKDRGKEWAALTTWLRMNLHHVSCYSKQNRCICQNKGFTASTQLSQPLHRILCWLTSVHVCPCPVCTNCFPAAATHQQACDPVCGRAGRHRVSVCAGILAPVLFLHCPAREHRRVSCIQPTVWFRCLFGPCADTRFKLPSSCLGLTHTAFALVDPSHHLNLNLPTHTPSLSFLQVLAVQPQPPGHVAGGWTGDKAEAQDPARGGGEYM